MSSRPRCSAIALAALLFVSSRAIADEPQAHPAFAVLRKCVGCHRGDEAAGGLDLSRRESALKGGESGAAIVSGDANASLAYRRAKSGKMPPKSPLSPSELQALETWINSGSLYDGEIKPDADAVAPGWAWKRLTSPPVPKLPPAVSTSNPIDAFIGERLQREELARNLRAEPRILVRRLHFDLVGLPPAPEVVDAFVAEPSDEAYAGMVDRLLASPDYGERWGRHWLDVARFGESDGFEYDKVRPLAWPYRDYVIKSLNADKPYPEFVREQLAGDVIEGATRETIAATGFLVAGAFDEANSIQSNLVMRARSREEELEDIVAAAGQTFLGLTINCARCHDHKFDPIPQEDFTRFASAFAGIRHGERPAIGASEIAHREGRGAELRSAISLSDREIAEVELKGRKRLASNDGKARELVATPRFRWSFDSGPDADSGGIRGRLEGNAVISGGRLTLNGKGAHLAAGPLPSDLAEKTLEAWAHVSDSAQGGGSILTVQARGGAQFDAIVYGEREPRKWISGSEGFVRTKDLSAEAEPVEPRPLVHVAISYDADGTIRIYRDGEPYAQPYRPEKSARTYPATESEILIGLRHRGAGNGYFSGTIDEARIYDRALSSEEIAASFREGPGGVPLADVLAALSPEERSVREAAVVRRDAATRTLRDLTPIPMVYAAKPEEPGVSHIHLRGDVEKKGKIVSTRGLSAIKRPNPDFNLPPDAPEAERRRKLAGWIADPNNGLTYRVMANRLWHYHFGVGLVPTPNDFGASGEPPSHPELLDYLAASLRDSGGSLKALHRQIVLSETYRQSSQYDEKAASKDSDARLLWRYPPRRLEGEAIRDAMLSVSGRLNPQRFGPSFRPFTAKVFGSTFYTLNDLGTPEYERRTIYRIHVLSAKDPMLESLDCPDPAVKAPRRGVTTTPLQALALMNDTFVIRQARSLAERAQSEVGADLGKQIDRVYRLAFGRSPSDAEQKRAESLAKSNSLSDVAWAVLNSTEFVYVE